jgi:hypothetical protein
LLNAPLLEKANPAYSVNPTKAPWYFAGVQELLMHFHPFFAAFVIPFGVVIFFAWIPFFRYKDPPHGNWFISEKGKRSAVYSALFASIVTLSGILVNEYITNFETAMPGMPALISNGILPFLVLIVFMAGYYLLVLYRLRLSKAELVQTVFVFIVVAFIVLTLIGILFRGKDMEISWP